MKILTTSLYRLMGLGSIVALAFLGLAVFSTPALAGSGSVDDECENMAERVAGWEEDLNEDLTKWYDELAEDIAGWEEDLAEGLADLEPGDDNDVMADHDELVAEAKADHEELVTEAKADHAERVAELTAECPAMM